MPKQKEINMNPTTMNVDELSSWAKPGCMKCYGRGWTGAVKGKKLICRCVTKALYKARESDEERGVKREPRDKSDRANERAQRLAEEISRLRRVEEDYKSRAEFHSVNEEYSAASAAVEAVEKKCRGLVLASDENLHSADKLFSRAMELRKQADETMNMYNELNQLSRNQSSEAEKILQNSKCNGAHKRLKDVKRKRKNAIHGLKRKARVARDKMGKLQQRLEKITTVSAAFVSEQE